MNTFIYKNDFFKRREYVYERYRAEPKLQKLANKGLIKNQEELYNYILQNTKIPTKINKNIFVFKNGILENNLLRENFQDELFTNYIHYDYSNYIDYNSFIFTVMNDLIPNEYERHILYSSLFKNEIVYVEGKSYELLINILSLTFCDFFGICKINEGKVPRIENVVDDIKISFLIGNITNKLCLDLLSRETCVIVSNIEEPNLSIPYKKIKLNRSGYSDTFIEIVKLKYEYDYKSKISFFNYLIQNNSKI